jgi:2-keto-3-deoxy-L-fuconate dehydrogenase
MTARLEGRRVLVTGAGAGIGRAIALRLAAEGAHVVATSRTADTLADVSGPSIEVVALDVTDRAAVVETVGAAGPLDVLVNCAGYVHTGTVLDCAEEDWAASLDTNVTAAFRTIRAALPAMLECGEGAIVNVASVASSVTGVANRAAYGASKAALVGLTKAVARDFIRQGIRCNALCPGTTLSPSLEARIAAAPDPEAMRATFTDRQPIGRLGTTAEMAEAALFLADPACTFMTGQLLVVDGGQTL